MKNDILFLGDSHVFHCFANGTVDVYYIIDLTLNKIRKYNSDVMIKYDNYYPLEFMHKYEMTDEGSSMVDLINNSIYNYVLISVGEIDVRSFHSLLIDDYVFNNTMGCFYNFIKKITKKVIILNIPPPSHQPELNILSDRIKITNKINNFFKELSKENNIYFFDIYSDFEINGVLDYSKSDGGPHIDKSYQNYILEKFKNSNYL